jgi:hypothetical protein
MDSIPKFCQKSMQAVRKTKKNENICNATKIVCAQGKQQLEKHLLAQVLGWELPWNDRCHACLYLSGV